MLEGKTRREILLVNQRQFGYHITYLKYCIYLKYDFVITYLCWDYGREKIAKEGLDVIYVSRKGNLVIRNLRFIKQVISQIANHNYIYIMVNDFRGCSFIPFIFNYKYHIHLNIVTGSVSPSALSRFIYNLLIRWESYFFRNVSVISEGLKKTLKLSHNAFILPLGADPMMIKRHCTHKLSLLYIGILSDRRIDDTIEGIAIFVRKNPDFDIHYTIIGYGWSGAEEILMKKIVSGKLEKYVDLKDYVPHSELIHFFEKANVGISYIPITPYFDYQPATKTFEYLMAGLPVIATGTYENKNIINNQNGIIIDDTPESFADSLDYLTENITSFNEKIIKGTVIGYDWETIVEKLKGIINNLNEDEENRRV